MFTKVTKNEVEFASSLDSLSHGTADSVNGFRLDDLNWEHFSIDSESGQVVCNRDEENHIIAGGSHLGGLEEKSVLELGAYEGYHALQMERMGVSEITAIEGNPQNFLKCAIVKNHFQLNDTHYLLGDCGKYLQGCDRRFDMVLASGILYHLYDPIDALENICKLTDTIVICTTYFHPVLQGFKFTGNTKNIDIPGLNNRKLYERSNTQLVKGKKHGMDETAWMFDFDTLIEYLSVKGYECEIIMKVEEPNPLRVRTRLIAYK